MLLKIIEYLSRHPKTIVMGVCILLIILSGGLDYLSGYDVSIDILYLIPIFFVSAGINKYSGLLIAVISTIVKLLIGSLTISPNQKYLVVYFNSFIYLLTAIMITLVSSELSESIKREKLISRAERQSRKKFEKVYQELEMTHQQLRQYALRIEDQATLQERNRIAREIHDGLGHTLTAQTIQINNALIFWETKSEQAFIAIKQAKQLGAEALLEVRKSVSMLRSNPLSGRSLESAINKLIEDFNQNTGIETLNNFSLPQSLPSEIDTTLYRIIQESLTNIHKHACAKTVNIDLLQQEGFISLMIEDDGKGFDPTQNTTGFGLQGIRERTLAICGQFVLDSQIEKGCRIFVSFSLANFNLNYSRDSDSISRRSVYYSPRAGGSA